jgi:TfoX N-terminal domain
VARAPPERGGPAQLDGRRGLSRARVLALAYDEDLANRVRELIGRADGLTEVRMFGGLSFLLDGNLCVAVSSRGGILVRIGPEAAEAASARAHCSRPVMGGREMRGWVRVAPEGLRTKRQLAAWVDRAVAFVRRLPSKG